MAYVSMVRYGEMKVVEVNGELVAIQVEESHKGKRVKLVIHASERVRIYRETSEELFEELERRQVVRGAATTS